MLDHQYGQNINPLLYIAFGLGFLFFFVLCYFQKISRNEN